MKFDQPSGNPEQELMKMWQENALPGPLDAAQIVQEIAGRVNKFDRTIWWRNFREYAAGAILIVFFVWESFNPTFRLIALAGIVAVGFVMIYLWWSHRQIPPLDPAANGKAYQAALLDRYDRQIRLLSKVKYWYVLPLYSWMIVDIAVAVPSQKMGLKIGAGLFATAFSLFIVWLNEWYAVKKLRDKREQAEALLGEDRKDE